MSNRLERYQQFPKRLSSARYKTIIFSDEEIFTMELFMNRQNDHILSPNVSSANSNGKLIGRRAHPQSIPVWAATAYHGKSSLVFVPQNAKINTETYQILFKIKLLFPGPKSILNPSLLLSAGFGSFPQVKIYSILLQNSLRRFHLLFRMTLQQP